MKSSNREEIPAEKETTISSEYGESLSNCSLVQQPLDGRRFPAAQTCDSASPLFPGLRETNSAAAHRSGTRTGNFSWRTPAAAQSL